MHNTVVLVSEVTIISPFYGS